MAAPARAAEASAGSVFAAYAVCLALACVPIFSSVLPPIVDYPNHLARLHLLAEGGNAFYEVRWAALPNLAADLIVPALALVMPIEAAGKLFLVAIFALLTGGALWLNRVITGAWRFWPLLAFLLLYNRTFLWGFINYLFGLGVALCGVALWLAMERCRPWQRVLASALVALVCYFSHIAAFGIYALVILGIEAGPAFGELRARRVRALCRRIALAAAQLVIPVAIHFVLTPRGAGGVISYTGFWRKADLLFSVFDNYSRPFDVVCFAAFVGMLGWLAWTGRLRMPPRLRIATGLILVAYVLMPSQIDSGSSVDHRLPVALFLLLIASAVPAIAERRLAVGLGLAAALVLAARLYAVEQIWLSADGIYAADLAVLDDLPRGAKLAVAFPPSAIAAGGVPQLHVAAAAVWRREAFVPTLFAYPTQQPLVLRPPYRALADAVPPGAFWFAFVIGEVKWRQAVAAVLDRYDYVVFADRAAFTVPSTPCLEARSATPSFQLFALAHGGACRLP